MSNDKLQKWALIAEVIAAVAVVVSLVFVGMQIRHSAEETRQNAEATRAATVLQLKQSWVSLNAMLAANLELQRIWALQEEKGFQILSREERGVAEAHIRGIIHIWSNSYYQYRIGTLELDQWYPVLRDIDGMVEEDFFWYIWDGWEHIFDDEFRELINSKRPSE